jgi:methylphosphotriester-DNA--protein-cysteine methyltransferase
MQAAALSLHAKFQASTGLSAHSWLCRHRRKQVVKILRNTNDPVGHTVLSASNKLRFPAKSQVIAEAHA